MTVHSRTKGSAELIPSMKTSCLFSTGVHEHFLLSFTEEGLDARDAFVQLEQHFQAFRAAEGLEQATPVFCRIFFSDLANQFDLYQQSPLFRSLEGCPSSCVQQPPLFAGLSLFVYWLDDRRDRPCQIGFSTGAEGEQICRILGDSYRQLWTANQQSDGVLDSERQTEALHQDYVRLLEQEGMTMLGSGIRSWIYVRDIDNHYAGMVKARREFFEQCGLNRSTRFLASTGIEARMRTPSTLVSIDALSVANLDPAQIVRMEAPAYLCPTMDYDVTFERGLAIRYGDRSHLYLSGTASIDSRGLVVHVGDAAAQMDRTLDNLEALLEGQDAGLKDMAYLLIYLRNASDRCRVREVVEQRLDPEIPRIYLKAPVCRPEWLVEIEGVAVIHAASSYPNFL